MPSDNEKFSIGNMPRHVWHLHQLAKVNGNAARHWIRRGDAEKAARKAREAASFASQLLNVLGDRYV